MVLGFKLYYQHRIPIAEKPVLFLDRLPVSLEDFIPSGKCGDQHQQGRLRQMKVRHQSIDRLEPVTRVNEQIA